MNLCVAEKAVLPKIEAETEAKTMQHGKMQTSSHYHDGYVCTRFNSFAKGANL